MKWEIGKGGDYIIDKDNYDIIPLEKVLDRILQLEDDNKLSQALNKRLLRESDQFKEVIEKAKEAMEEAQSAFYLVARDDARTSSLSMDAWKARANASISIAKSLDNLEKIEFSKPDERQEEIEPIEEIRQEEVELREEIGNLEEELGRREEEILNMSQKISRLKALMPRWVKSSNFDRQKMMWVQNYWEEDGTLWHLGIPLPLPELPISEEQD